MEFARGCHVATEKNPDLGHILAIGRTRRPLWTLRNGEDTYSLVLTYSCCIHQYYYCSIAHGICGAKWNLVFSHGAEPERFLRLDSIEIKDPSGEVKTLKLADDVTISFGVDRPRL